MNKLFITLKTVREKFHIEDRSKTRESGILMRDYERKREKEKFAHDFRVAIGLSDPISDEIPYEFTEQSHLNSRSTSEPHWTGD